MMLNALLFFHVLSGIITLSLVVHSVASCFKTQQLHSITTTIHRLMFATVVVSVSGIALTLVQIQAGSTSGLCTKLALYLGAVTFSLFLILLRYRQLSNNSNRVLFAFRSELSLITGSWITLLTTAQIIGW